MVVSPDLAACIVYMYIHIGCCSPYGQKMSLSVMFVLELDSGYIDVVLLF